MTTRNRKRTTAPPAAPPQPSTTVLLAVGGTFLAAARAKIQSTHHAATLCAIAVWPGRSTHEIAARIEATRAATTRAIIALVRAGLVTNRIDPEDNRLRIIEVTPKGAALLPTFTGSAALTTPPTQPGKSR